MKRVIFCAILVSCLLAVVVCVHLLVQRPNLKSITISRGTTYLTEPLRSDGYPDYVAALNQEASQGVTPENNAVVVLMQAFGPGVINRKDRGAFFKLLGIDAPPEKGDYFVDYDEFVKEQAPYALLNRDGNGRWRCPRSYQEFERSERPWANETCPLIAAWLAANEKPLALIAEASKRPRCYFPFVTRSDWLASIDLWLPMKSVAYFLARRATLRLHEGQIDRAWDDLQTCHQLARLPGWGSRSLANLHTAMSCEMIASWHECQLAHRVKLTPEQVRRFNADMEKLVPIHSVLDQPCKFERFVYLDAICATARGGLKPIDIIPMSRDLGPSVWRGGDSPKWNALRDSLTTWIDSGQVDWDQALRLGSEHFDRIDSMARMPALRERRIAAAALAEEIDRQQVVYGYPRRWHEDQPEDVTKPVGPPRSVVTQGLFAIYWSQLDNDSIYRYCQWRVTIASQLVPIALALSVYRTEYGQYPDKLEALRPKYVAQLPKDPWADGDCLYRREGNGYVLYSVGPNGIDNTGPIPRRWSSPPDPPDIGKSDDIGIRVPERFLRHAGIIEDEE